MSAKSQSTRSGGKHRRCRDGLFHYFAIAILFCTAVACLGQQQPRIAGNLKVTNFKVAPEFFDPPNQAQVKWMLEGAEAEPKPDGLVVVKDARLRRFRMDGSVELEVKTPQCIFDQGDNSIRSPGLLHAQTGDGRSQIEGTGFLWQTNSTLMLSNDVKTLIQPDTLGSGAPADGRNALTGPLTVTADHLEYSSTTAQGVFRDNVRISGTNLNMTSGLLTLWLLADKEAESWSFKTITAEKDVVIDYHPINATAQKAVYTTGTGLLQLTGNPRWQSDQREGGATELTVDRTNQLLEANGDAWIRMPGGSGGGGGFLPGNRRSGQQNAETAGTNAVVEILAGRYTLRTNSASFERDVRVTETESNRVVGFMSAANVDVRFIGTNEVDRLTATGGVRITHDDQELTAGTATYTGADQTLRLEDKPAWRAGLRKGSGDHIRINLAQDEMHVEDGAGIRLPAEQFGIATIQASGAQGAPPKTASPSAAAGDSNVKRRERRAPGTNEFAEITSVSYDINPKTAAFRGGVRFDHPQMQMTCEIVDARFSPAGDMVESILADRHVVFILKDEVGHEAHGAGDQLVYNYNTQESVTNDIIRLIGNPATLQQTNTIVHNNVIIFDRGANTVYAPGLYVVTSTAAPPSTSTNFTAWPKRKKAK
jgi:lipopolysaccharide export system protein LptA